MNSALAKNSSKSINKKFWLSLTILVICAVAIRSLYFFTYHPPLDSTIGDSPLYDIPAWNLLNGNGYTDQIGEPFASREPGYAFLILVPTYALFGHSFLALIIIQYMLDIAMMGLIIWFLYRNVNLRTAIFGGIIYIFYLPFVFQNGEILSELPYQLCLMISLGVFILAVNKKSRWLMLLTGALIGYTALVRWGAIMLPPFLVLSIWFITKNLKQTVWLGACLFIGMTIVTAPWIARNYIVFDQFVFGRIGGGEIYWSGSYLPYDGEWMGDTAESRAIKDDLSLIEYDKKFTTLAIEQIRQKPFQVAWVWLKKPFKIYLFPEAINYINIESRGPLTKGALPSILLLLFSIGLHWILLLAGIISLKMSGLSKTIRYSFAALFIFSIIIYLPLNPVPRYNVPLMPFLIILAAPVLYTTSKKLYGNIKAL